MSSSTRRAPTGHATLQARVSEALARATLEELAVTGYARLAVEGVAKRAGVGKTAVYRRWPSKLEMVIAALADGVVPTADMPDTGTLRGDVLAALRAVHAWLTHPLYGAILPDLTSVAARDAELAHALWREIGQPRRELATALLHRAVARGELAADIDVELALDVLAGPLYWRLAVRRVPVDENYLEELCDWALRALPSPAG